MTTTSATSTITQALVDLMVTNKTTLGLKDIFYGDQNLIPRTPSLSVDPGPRLRDYTQTGLQTTVELTEFIMIYHSQYKDLQTVKKATDVLAEDVEAVLHLNRTEIGTGSQLVVHSLVTSVEPGFAERGKQIFVVHRLTWEALVKERIGV